MGYIRAINERGAKKIVSKKKIDYIKSYNLKTYRRYELNIRQDDKKVIEKLNNQKSVNGYLLNLIRKDIDSKWKKVIRLSLPNKHG